MVEGKRPGGLTALAVINFIFGGLNALSVLGLVAALALVGVVESTSGEGDDGFREVAKAFEEIGLGYLYLILAISLVEAILLVVSGVGYLKQKRFLGRKLGNTYGILAIAGGLLGAFTISAEAGGGLSMGTIAGLIYPALTLILLNGTFKEDFINP